MTPPETVCAIHCEFEKRYDSDQKAQEKVNDSQSKVNDQLFSKLNGMDSKINWILGGVVVGWPLVLIIITMLWKVKP